MKFDSFIKYAGSNGTILTASTGHKWLVYGCIAMMIPEGKNVCGRELAMPTYMEDLLYDYGCEACYLLDAYVPKADSKPSELMRVFANSDCSNKIDISNKAFGFIERNDRTFISEHRAEDEEGNVTKYTALLVTDEYGDVDEIDFKMIIVEKETDDNE